MKLSDIVYSVNQPKILENDGEKYLNKNDVLKIIEDCKPFFESVQYRPDDYTLFRGMRKSERWKPIKNSLMFPDLAIKMNVRKDREPLDTPKHISKMIDDFFEQKFGHRFRQQSIFCISDPSKAIEYGTVFVILPIGEFSYCWSTESKDLYNDVFESSTFEVEDYKNETAKQIKKKVFDKMAVLDFRNNGLLQATTNFKKHEIMVKCDSYYAIDKKLFQNDFMDLFRLVTKQSK